MNLAATSHALVIGVAAALAFAFLLLAGRLLIRLPGRAFPFSGSVINEPAQRVRDRWQELGRRRSQLLLPLLVLAVVATTVAVAARLSGSALRGPAPAGWQQYALLLLLAIVSVYALYRLVVITLQRRRLHLRWQAGLVVGHALQRLSANHNRTFHDVPCSSGVMDHVVVGLHGIYAVHVIARRPRRNGIATLEDDAVVLGNEQDRYPVDGVRKVAARLARECGKVVRHDVHIRLVVTVPGWEIRAQTSDDILLTNERNLTMLTGWKDQRDYLMDDDVDKLHALFDERCARVTGQESAR
ncbi:MAG: hypothetical protein U5K76_06605 [Woeseiaceae bacterium]|nr:hypothetical protein [Woeseiaceae bacterium]